MQIKCRSDAPMVNKLITANRAYSLFAYVLSSLLAKLMFSIKWQVGEGEMQTLQGWVYEHWYLGLFSDYNASLAYALTNVLVVLAITWILYSRKVFIRL
jgi:predicted acyltransferase